MMTIGNRPCRRSLCGLTAVAALFAFAGATHAAEDYKPKMSPGAKQTEFDENAFKPMPTYDDKPYDIEAQLKIYGGKSEVEAPRPLFELGHPQYVAGQLPEPSTAFGELNPTQFAVQAFGDWRTAIAFNDFGGNELGQIATRLNIDIDMKITSTERLHAFIRPIDSGANFTRCELFGNDKDEGCELESDLNLETLFFEGDFGAIASGLTGDYYKTDRPFTFGLVPLFFQNGLWMDDAIWGGAFAFPALNSPAFDISNMDFTIFAGFDEITNNGIVDANGQTAAHNVNIYGGQLFIEMQSGYIETGLAYLDADNAKLGDQDIWSFAFAWSARFRDIASYSVRYFLSEQDNQVGQNNGTGMAVLLETSWNTHKPYTLIPYANMWFGLNRPQPAGNAEGLLVNTGINFETDALTGFPFLDDTAADTFGGAIGVQYLFDLDQQLVFEAASVQKYGNQSNIAGDQYAFGVRWQLPVSQAWILRADAMYGIRNNDDDISGVRFEVRRKF
ncbi:MAG: hypothetical protein VYB54_01600 [Pseudomonadota bacterium]|nr:hypothetical protein [Pseudomonadota bacterium]